MKALSLIIQIKKVNVVAVNHLPFNQIILPSSELKTVIFTVFNLLIYDGIRLP